MGWLSDLWAKIVNYISNFIRNMLTAITQWIENARVAIAKFKYKLRMKIAGWIQDDTSLLLLSFAAIVAVVMALIIGNMPFVAKLITAFKTMKDNFKNRLGNIAGIVGFQTALAVHRISLIFFPEYQRMIGDLHASVSSFMDVVGEPFRTASLLLENARTLVYASYTLLGIEDDYKEAAWVESVQGWVNKTADRIERYTRNPELIMQDIWMEVVQPNLADGNQAMSTIYSTLHGLSNKALEFTDNLDNFRNALDNFTGAMPEEIRIEVEKRIAPITDKLDWLLDEKLIPLTDKVSEGFAVIDQIILENEMKIVKLAGKIDDPLYLLELIDKLSGSRRDQALKILALLLLEKEYITKQKVYEIIDVEYEAAMRLQKMRLAEPIIDKVTTVERSDLSVLIGQIKYSKDSWFVGEY